VIVHLNGQLIPARDAAISPFDRGFLFGDGLYEGLRASHGRIFAMPEHLERLQNGMRELDLMGFDVAQLMPMTTELLRANGLTEAFVYWQITRGEPGPGQGCRDRVPPTGMKPTVFGFAEPTAPVETFTRPRPLRAALLPDMRWSLGHIKAITLLGSVLAGQEAARHGADDAILFRSDSGEPYITEGLATNVVALIDGQLVTPALSSAPILAGVTRRLLLEGATGITQRVLTVSELRRAEEIMLVGTRTMVASVTELDGRPVGKGLPGHAAHRLLELLCARILADVGCAPVAR
jgi:D-alanine transaminase